MNKKKLLAILAVALVTVFCISTCLASNMPEIGTSALTKDDNGAGSFAKDMLKTIQYIGYAIAIGWFLYLGIKYVMASADEKANLKGGMIKMVIGIILIAGASTIIGWIVDAKIFG